MSDETRSNPAFHIGAAEAALKDAVRQLQLAFEALQAGAPMESFEGLARRLGLPEPPKGLSHKELATYIVEGVERWVSDPRPERFYKRKDGEVQAVRATTLAGRALELRRERDEAVERARADFKAGDRVRHIAGGPVMAVVRVGEPTALMNQSEPVVVFTCWFDEEDKRFGGGEFVLRVLRKVDGDGEHMEVKP
jgi:hypothetical protein